MSGDLFRALREDEVVAGFVPIPKSVEPFVAHPRLPNVLPVSLAPSIDHALREHQWHGKYQTRGVSTTPHFERALHYAGRTGVIIRIEAASLPALGISALRVADHVPAALIEIPEDDEVVLVSQEDGPLPTGCVAEVIRVQRAS